MSRGNAYKLLRKLATRAGRTKLGRFIAEGDTFLRPSLQFWLGSFRGIQLRLWVTFMFGPAVRRVSF